MENNNAPIFETGEVKKENVYGSCKCCGKPIPYGVEYCENCLKEINESKKKGMFKTIISIVVGVVIAGGIALGVILFLNRNGKNNWKVDSNGVAHYYGASGKMEVDTLIKDGSDIYYVDEKGAKVVEDWAQVDDKYYYFDKDGIAIKGKWGFIENKWYFFDKDGVMLSNTWKEGEDGVKYYLGPFGDMQANTICDIGGSTYYFDKDGVIKVNTLVNANGGIYYAGENGIIEKNKWVANHTYYAGDDGKILMNTITPDGKKVDAYGKYVDEAAMKAPPKQTIQPTQPPKTGGDVVTNIDTSKPVWIQSYQTYSDYITFDDDTNVDISIKCPVFGGQNAEEVQNINDCFNNLTEEMVRLADAKISEEEKPTKYQITEAEIANVDDNKVNVVLKGKLVRSGKSAKDIRIRFIYDRTSATAYVTD